MDERRFSKKDLERNEDPQAVAGAISGAAAASIGGSIGMAALGPVGAVVGLLAGAIGGWWAGNEIQESIDEMDSVEKAFRSAHAATANARPYGEVRHAYQVGYLAGRNPQYRGKSFRDVEDELRAAWVKAHLQNPEGASWEESKDHARAGFDVARGDRSAT
jgi:phage tail tape-measure protein